MDLPTQERELAQKSQLSVGKNGSRSPDNRAWMDLRRSVVAKEGHETYGEG